MKDQPIELPPLPEPGEAMSKWAYDEQDMQAYALAAIEADRQARGEYVLAKHQPCGCVICTCEDNGQCQGCGARHCGTHPIAKFSNPVYEMPSRKARGEPIAWIRVAVDWSGAPKVVIAKPNQEGAKPVYLAPQPAEPVKCEARQDSHDNDDPSGADGYAYRYRHIDGGTVLRFNHGEEVNGRKPIEAVPFWFKPQPQQIPEYLQLVPKEPTYFSDGYQAGWNSALDKAADLVGGSSMTSRHAAAAIRALKRDQS